MEFAVSCQEFPSMKQGLAPTLKITPHGHHLVKEEPASSGDSLAFPGTSASAYGSLFKKSPGHSLTSKQKPLSLGSNLIQFFVNV